MSTTKKVKGYKAFNHDLTCRGMQYEVGKTYKLGCEPIICERGFHFCQNLSDVYNYYPMTEDTRICEVEALGTVVTDMDGIKSCTNKIKILKEIKNPKAKTNVENENSGWFNSGHNNSGNHNSGSFNSGDYNSGSHNSGYSNCGDYNSGECNNGNYNIGDHNTGDNNYGSRNSGDYNRGYWNVGDYNRGSFNCGDYNRSDFNCGCFNTETNPKIKLFNKKSNWTISKWRVSTARAVLANMPVDRISAVFERNITDEEKETYPEYKTTGVYLKHSYPTDEDRQIWWDNLYPTEREVVLALPNFDADIFYQCTGIKV